MPIHVTSQLRRMFQHTSLGAGVSLLTFGQLHGEDLPNRTQHVILLADTHIAAEPGSAARGPVMAANLQKVIADILDPSPLPAFALILSLSLSFRCLVVEEFLCVLAWPQFAC